jgi:hypothetical protein
VTFFPRGAPLYILKHLVEREAQNLRAYLGLAPGEPIDPFEVAEWLGLEVQCLSELTHVPRDVIDLLLGESATHWSGMTFHLPDALVITIMNPTHSPGRQAATLMEEVAHLHLGHAPSTVAADGTTGLVRRSYDRRVEEEAYLFGSAMLVPKVGLRDTYASGYSRVDAARYYGVSLPLINYRTNLHGLRKLAG